MKKTSIFVLLVLIYLICTNYFFSRKSNDFLLFRVSSLDSHYGFLLPPSNEYIDHNKLTFEKTTSYGKNCVDGSFHYSFLEVPKNIDLAFMIDTSTCGYFDMQNDTSFLYITNIHYHPGLFFEKSEVAKSIPIDQNILKLYNNKLNRYIRRVILVDSSFRWLDHGYIFISQNKKSLYIALNESDDLLLLPLRAYCNSTKVIDLISDREFKFKRLDVTNKFPRTWK